MTYERITACNCTCDHCGHTWMSRKGIPAMCPRCKRHNWNDGKNQSLGRVGKQRDTALSIMDKYIQQVSKQQALELDDAILKHWLESTLCRAYGLDQQSLDLGAGQAYNCSNCNKHIITFWDRINR